MVKPALPETSVSAHRPGCCPLPTTPRTPPPGTQLPGDIEVIPPPHSGLDVFCGTPLDIRYSYAHMVHSSDVSSSPGIRHTHARLAYEFVRSCPAVRRRG